MKLTSPLKLFLSSKLNIKRIKVLPDESLLPEFIYAGKNLKPHTRVYVMGFTKHGALGEPLFLKPEMNYKYLAYMYRPHRLDFADENKVHDVACGYGFTVFAMKKSSEYPLYGTGISSNCQIGYHSDKKGKPVDLIIEPTPIEIPLSSDARPKKISCGRAHTVVWTDTDGLWTFGNNSFGQCGRDIISNEDYSRKVRFHRVSEFDGKSVEQVECGQDTSFVLSEGVVYSCGWSADGQTGRDTYENIESFGPVGGALQGKKVVKISSKVDCVLALTADGEVYGWGNSEYRQLSSITNEQQLNTPQKLNLEGTHGTVVDVAASGSCCFALTDSGDVWSWGYGILGTGPGVQFSEVPRQIPSTLLGRNILSPESKVKKIFSGVTSAAAVDSQGSLFTWGRNAGGCLGLGHADFQPFPLKVCVSSSVDRVSIGVDHMAVFAKSLV